MQFISHFERRGYVEGPLGFPVKESVARSLDELLRGLPKDSAYEYRRLARSAAKVDVEAEQRCDVSAITTDDKDLVGEVVLPKGMDARFYGRVVTLAHDYETPFGAANLWIKPAARGVLAKTKYFEKPEDWGDGEPWMPSVVLHLLKQTPPACTGKSIGFLPLSIREASEEEARLRPEWKGAPVIDRWALLEYAIAPVPCNPHAQTIAVSKGFKDDEAFAAIKAAARELVEGGWGGSDAVEGGPFDDAQGRDLAAVVSARAVAEAVARRLGFDDAKFRRLVEAGVADRLDRAMGRV